MAKLSKEKEEYFIKKLQECQEEDIECGHIDADDVLVEILEYLGVPNSIIREYKQVDKWYA